MVDGLCRTTEGKPGLAGAVTSRAEAQTMRLASIYALMDHSTVIRVEHLQAALALWQYAEQAALSIFGNATGDPTVDTIITALSQGDLSETEIHDLFGRNKSASEIKRALGVIWTNGKAKPLPVETGGRPKTIWRKHELNEKNEEMDSSFN